MNTINYVLVTAASLVSLAASVRADDAHHLNATAGADARDNGVMEAGAWQLQSQHTVTLDQTDLAGAPVKCTVYAFVPQGTKKKLAFRGEFTCTAAVQMALSVNAVIVNDDGTPDIHAIVDQVEYFESTTSGGHTAYTEIPEDISGVISTEVVGDFAPTGGTGVGQAHAQSGGVHFNQGS